MAKALQLRHGNALIQVELASKVSKKDLYGYAKRVAERNGVVLQKGALLAHGELLPTHCMSSVKADLDGSPSEAIQSTIGGEPAEMQPSSFDHAYEMLEVPISTLASFAVRDVYPVSVSDVAAGLYQTQFAYRKAITINTALLLVKPEQSFLLVGQLKQSSFLASMLSYEFFDADIGTDDSEDELDFQMV
jgi:hypothetical protein